MSSPGAAILAVNDAMPRRVLLLLPGAYGDDGGIQTYNRLLLTAAADIASRDGVAFQALILNDEPADVDSAPTRPVDTRGFGGSRPRFAAAAIRSAISFSPELVIFGHVNFSSLSPVLRAIRPRARHWFLTYGIEVWRRLGPIARRALARAERILTISEHTGGELTKANRLSPRGIAILPCAFDPALTALARREGLGQSVPERPSLLTVARLGSSERRKGIEAVLRALPEISRRVAGLRYVVIGDGDDRNRLESLSRELGLSDVVEFRGRVPMEALAQAYSECSVFVLPSSKEGFGIVYLEAAAFGKPSIAARGCGSQDAVVDGRTGLLVEMSDAEGLARAIVELLENPARARELGASARARLLELYSYERFKVNFGSLLAGASA